MGWLRELFWVCKIYTIRLVPHYINTKNNLVADTLSRILYIKSESEIRKCLWFHRKLIFKRDFLPYMRVGNVSSLGR